MGFYISKVTATGSGKPPASMEFNSGLNIICGVSDSGKTCILKCILYIMGDNKKPFDIEKTGYDSVNMDVVFNGLNIHLIRTLSKGSGIITVTSDSNDFNDSYDTKYNSNGNKRPVINELWLKLIGINDLPMIIKNQDCERQRLQWKTISRLFWLKEHDIEKPTSVLLPESPTQNPYFFSCLLFLLTGDNFPDADEQEKDEISTAKKNAIRQFVNSQISQMSARRTQLQQQLKSFGQIDAEKEIQNMITSLSETEKAIAVASDESKELFGTLLEYRENEAEISLTYKQFKSLESQYIADIKRLTFIVECEHHKHDLAPNTTCPFCNGDIKPKDKQSYIDASKAELSRIITQLQGLTESENDLSDNLKNIRKKIIVVESRRAEIEQLIESELTPIADKLKNSITSYRAYVQLEQQVSTIQELSQDWNTSMQEQEKDDETKVKFSPKKQYPVNFNSDIDEIAFNILEKCNYESLNTSHFNMGTFDLEVNGLVKEDSHGKGYWAFINTVLGLTIRQYLSTSAKYRPNLFVVDTPLLGLDQGVEDNAPESMRKALFQYFLDNQDDGQIILVENTKDLPDLEYIQNGANIFEFTQGKYKSKYPSRDGFLFDIDRTSNA